jgi:hypothetical protein
MILDDTCVVAIVLVGNGVAVAVVGPQVKIIRGS